MNQQTEITIKCPECELEYKPGEDARVDAGLKCSLCSYRYESAKAKINSMTKGELRANA